MDSIQTPNILQQPPASVRKLPFVPLYTCASRWARLQVRALLNKEQRELHPQVTLERRRSALASEQLSLQLPKHLCGAGLCGAGGSQRLFINARWQRSLPSATVHMHFLCVWRAAWLFVTMESDPDLDLVFDYCAGASFCREFQFSSLVKGTLTRGQKAREITKTVDSLSPQAELQLPPPFFSHFGNRKEAPGRGEGDAPRLTFPRAWAESRLSVLLHNKGCSDMNCIDVRAHTSVTI